MSANLSAFAYLVATILFIMALRGLSSPLTARQGNLFGMIGMGIAILTTLASPGVLSYWMIIIGILIGGSIGTAISMRIQMTALPQLVAAFHSLVGLAAVCVAVAAFSNPDAYGILGDEGIKLESRIEMGLGVAIGAITFTGSLIAFAKLNGNMSGAPIMLPARHLLNLAIAGAIVILIVLLVLSGGHALWAFWGIFARP